MGFYTCSEWHEIPLKKDFLLRALKDNGFAVIKTEQLETPPTDILTCNTSGFIFISACKK